MELPQTRWSVVRAAAATPSPRAQAALGELCEAYWYPLYAFVRRCGHGPDEALDLTQSFFVRLLEKREFGAADPDRGRFRTFLLRGVRYFLANEREREGALRRGGGVTKLSLDASSADARYALEPADETTPERLFDRAWARSLVDGVLEELAEEYRERGKAELFELLRPTLTDAGPPRAELAARLDATENAVKVAVHRLRARFRERLRGAIADTVDGRADVEDEIRYLLEAL